MDPFKDPIQALQDPGSNKRVVACFGFIHSFEFRNKTRGETFVVNSFFYADG